MIRTVLGGLVGGVILFVAGFIFWATPLGDIAYSRASEPNNAALQIALAQNLTLTGTGTYRIPEHRNSAAGTVLFGQGPVAVVHFNTNGFATDDSGTALRGFLFTLAAGLLIAFGLAASAAASFSARARLVICFALGVAICANLTPAVFNHFGWGFWIYSFIAESTGLILAGLVIARWFIAAPAAEAAAPASVEPAAPSES